MTDTGQAAPPGGEALGRLVRSGLGWGFTGNLLGRVGTFVSGIVMARLLSPEDYGVFTAALVALLFLMSLNDLGLNATLARWPGELRSIAPTAATLIFASSVMLYAALFVAAPQFSRAFDAPEAVGVVRLLCLAVLVDGAFAVPVASLTRAFRQDLRTRAGLVGFVLSTALSIALAVAGFGAWSLAWGRLAGNLVNVLLLYRWTPLRFRWGFRPQQARELLAFGVPLAGSTFLTMLMLNLDYLVVGRALGVRELGLYTLAFNLASWPVSVFSSAVRQVSLPGFGRLQGDQPALAAAFTRSLALLLAVTLPVCVLLAVLGAQVVTVVYGARWLPAVAALQFLAVLGLLRVGLDLGWDVLVAAGRSRTTVRLQALWLAALVPSLALGAAVGGIRGVAAAHVGVALLVAVPAFLAALRGLGIRTRPLATELTRPVLAGAAAALVALVVKQALDGAVWQLVSATAAGGVTYLLIVAPMRRLLNVPHSRVEAAADSSNPSLPGPGR